MTEISRMAKAAVLAAMLGFVVGSLAAEPKGETGKIEQAMQHAKENLRHSARDLSGRQ